MEKLTLEQEKNVLTIADFFVNFRHDLITFKALKSEGLNKGTHQDKEQRNKIALLRCEWMGQAETLSNFIANHKVGEGLPKPHEFSFFHGIIELLERIERKELKEIAQVYLTYLMNMREKVKRKNKEIREANELLREHSDQAFEVLLASLQKKCEAAGFDDYDFKPQKVELDEQKNG